MPRRLPAAEAASLFRLLGDPTRLRLLALLAERGEVSVTNISGALGEGQTMVSYHLSLLRLGGVIGCRRRGKWNYYRLTSPLAAELLGNVRD